MESNLKGTWNNFQIVHPTDILVKVYHEEKFKSQSGILLTINPSVVEDRGTRGVLLKKGKEVNNIPDDCTVYFENTSGYDLFFEGNKEEWFLLLDSKSLLGYSL